MEGIGTDAVEVAVTALVTVGMEEEIVHLVEETAPLVVETAHLVAVDMAEEMMREVIAIRTGVGDPEAEALGGEDAAEALGVRGTGAPQLGRAVLREEQRSSNGTGKERR